MKFDITLKALLQKAPRQLLQILVNSQPQEVLTVEYPSVKDRRPDLVVRLTDKRLYHLELQTTNDTTMPHRMLEYFSLILNIYQQEPFQQVLYVGKQTVKMSNRLTLNKLQFEYEIIDIRKIDCQPLLDSPNIEDNLLAILCHIEGKEREVIQQILYRIAQVTTKERRDFWGQLLILTGLRNIHIQQLVQQEGQKMPITVDMGATIWGKELFNRGKMDGIQEGERKGEALILQRQLTKRFGTLPAWATDKITQAQSEQLEQWSLRVLEASTLEEVFISC
jgi:hypothetical protein